MLHILCHFNQFSTEWQAWRILSYQSLPSSFICRSTALLHCLITLCFRFIMSPYWFIFMVILHMSTQLKSHFLLPCWQLLTMLNIYHSLLFSDSLFLQVSMHLFLALAQHHFTFLTMSGWVSWYMCWTDLLWYCDDNIRLVLCTEFGYIYNDIDMKVGVKMWNNFPLLLMILL